MNTESAQKERLCDQELLELLEHDPQSGMEAAVGQFTGLLWRIGEKYLQDPEDVKECVNDAFLEFYIHRDRFDPEKGTLTAYLAQIMRNLAISRYRKNVLWDHQSPARPGEPLSGQDQVEAQVDLERAMAALKPEDAEIIRMKYYGGMTVREIAASLKLPYDTVKKRHQRSLSRLRILLLSLLALGLLTLLAACAYTLPRYFGIIPGYGISGDPKALAFILEEPVQAEGDSGTCLIYDAVLLNGEMYILLDCRPPEQDSAENPAWDEVVFHAADTSVRLNGADRTFLPEITRGSRISQKGGWTIGLTCASLDPEAIPHWEGGIEAEFTLFDLDFRFRLVRVEAGQVSDYSHQLEDRGGLLAIPRLEEGRLIVGIYPLNTGAEALSASPLWGRFHESSGGKITVTAPDGQERVGEWDDSSAFGGKYFYDWSFGPARPGNYTLHVPYACLTAPLEEPVTFRIDLQRGTWDDQKYPVPGGTLSIEDCQPMEVPLGEPIPGGGGPFTVKEDTRLWTLRMRYEPSEDLVMTGCLLAPAEGMEVQSKVLYDIATGEDGNHVPLNVSGFHCDPISYGEEDNVVEMLIEGWEGCFDPANVLLTVSEPLSMRWEQSFDLPLTVSPE